MNPYFIGLDIGTSAVKAVAYTASGRFSEKKSLAYPIQSSQPGWQEQDPETVFNAAITVLRKLMAEKPVPPAFVALSSAMHSLLPLDKDGTPLTPLILWTDIRSADIAQNLKSTAEGKNIYRHTGTPIHPMSPLPKIAWLREHRPDIFQKIHKFADIKTYLVYRLFGELLTDYSMASATGLFDAESLDWFGPSLDFAGISADKLPALVSPFFVLKNLKKEFARHLGMPAETPFVIGASDGCLANLGAGAMSPGQAVLSIGTSGALRMTTAQPVQDVQERIFNYLLWNGVGEGSPVFITGGASNNGAVVYEWFTRQFFGKKPGAKSMEQHRQAMSGTTAGSDGLIFLPWLYGERAPLWNARAQGVFFGLTERHTIPHFHRAVLEGILLNLALIGQVLEEKISPIGCIFANGGFTRMQSWVQMAADVFGTEVRIFENEDAPALGAVITGMKAMGTETDFFMKNIQGTPLRIFHSDENNHRMYRSQLEMFRELAGRLEGMFDK